jgi:hypothetical protein
MCRAVRAQRFLRHTRADARMREEKAAAALAALEAPARRQLTAAQADAFYARLLKDTERRIHKRRAQRPQAHQDPPLFVLLDVPFMRRNIDVPCSTLWCAWAEHGMSVRALLAEMRACGREELRQKAAEVEARRQQEARDRLRQGLRSRSAPRARPPSKPRPATAAA